MEDEKDLISRLKARDERALIQLGEIYGASINGIARRILRNHHDAEEVAQDVLVVVWTKIDVFRNDCSLRTWICRIAWCRALNRYHHRRRRFALPLAIPAGEFGGTMQDILPDRGLSTPRIVELGEIMQAVGPSIEQLTPMHRDILRMIADGQTYDEISAGLGIPIGTVRSRIARAREYLKKMLEEAVSDIVPERVA